MFEASIGHQRVDRQCRDINVLTAMNDTNTLKRDNCSYRISEIDLF